MRFLPGLFANNRAWAADSTRRDPDFFRRLCDIQRPGYLWIGCADSRVPANEIVGLAPGELFVHRNVANVVAADDDNGLAVLQFAIETLEVPHVIVCGHYGCGGVRAALGPPVQPPLESWLRHIREVAHAWRGGPTAVGGPTPAPGSSRPAPMMTTAGTGSAS
jgi:carbonic anhydrase